MLLREQHEHFTAHPMTVWWSLLVLIVATGFGASLLLYALFNTAGVDHIARALLLVPVVAWVEDLLRTAIFEREELDVRIVVPQAFGARPPAAVCCRRCAVADAPLLLLPLQRRLRWRGERRQ